MKKFRPLLEEHELSELKRISTLDFSTYTEADVREEFLVEILKLLGYRKDLDYSVSREESFKLSPLFLMVGSTRIRLDYLCSLRKQYFWIVDAKTGKPDELGVIPSIAKEDVIQTFFYSQHPEVNCRYFVVSNGWYTNLYDRDGMDENYTPLLSIKHTEMFERFLELDSYIGATQILPKIKERILDQVEKVFAAEIRAERLDEFTKAVQEKANLARPKVQRAATESFSRQQTDPYKYLETEDLSLCVHTVFQSMRSRADVSNVSNKIISRLEANKKNFEFKEYFFFARLMLEEPRPVSFWYYPMVLAFLFQADERGIKPIYYGMRTIRELLEEWLDLCLFHFSNRKPLRYLWAIEKLYAKIIKQSIVLFPMFREKIGQALNNELFYIPEEMLAPLGPSSASVVVKTVEDSTTVFLGRFLQKYYDHSTLRFKENLALQEYNALVATSKMIDETFGANYEELKKELGDDWSDIQWYESLTLDRMGSAVMDVLLCNEHRLDILTQAQRDRIKLMAELGHCNFADGVCDRLGIAFIQPDEERQDVYPTPYFDPSIDQHQK